MNKGIWDIIHADFITSAVRTEQYPKPALPEVAFIGRSNVGKSSLINSLCKRRGLARVSSTPGKTQTLNFYGLEAKRVTEEHEDRTNFYLVDLPGYGFAQTGRGQKEMWSGFISRYLSEAPDLQYVCLLMDIRHKLQENDIACYHWLLNCALNIQVVLTKADKVSRNVAEAQKALFKRELGLSEERVLAYSTTQPVMRTELINRILAALEAKDEHVLENADVRIAKR